MKSSKLRLVVGVQGGKGNLALGRRIAQVMGLAILLLASIGAWAQATPDVEQGMKAYGSYHGGNLDQISLTNGNLFFHADLLAYSQRGGELSRPVVLQYNGKNLSQVQQTCPPGTPTSQCPLRLTTVFGANPLASQSVSSPGNSVTIGYEGLPFASIYSAPVGIDTGQSFNGREIFFQSYAVVTSDGSVHQLVSTNSGYATVDGSGFVQSTSGMLTDRRGTQYGAAVVDRNGNKITIGSDGSFVDTLGRHLPAQPGPAPTSTPAPSTASLSACPALNYAFQPVTYAYTWNLPTTNGGTLPLILCYTPVFVRTGQPNTPPIFAVNQSFYMLQSVVLPDNTFWAFQYDAADPNNTSSYAFGDLLKVTLPTGGSITYTFAVSGAAGGSGIDRAVQTRTVDANDGTGQHAWHYSFVTGQTIVTDPLNNDTVHTFTMLGNMDTPYETQMQYYQGPHNGGTLLKTVKTDYQFTSNPWDPGVIGGGGASSVTNVFPFRVTTTLPNGLVSKVESDYDTALAYHGPLDGMSSNNLQCPFNDECFYAGTPNGTSNYTGSYGKVVARREYDWGQGAPGALLRQTKTTYQWQVNSAYLAANLMDLPASVQVLDGNDHQVALTTYGYDESSLTPSNVTTQFGAAPASVRGNLTSTHHWLNTSNSLITSTATYFDSGEVQSATDPLNHSTTHTYSLTYAGAFPTQTCNALNQCVSGVYDFNTGLLTSLTDANQQISNFSYDPQLRLTQALGPTDLATGLRPETDFDYSVLNQVKRSKRQNASSWIVDYAYFDGFGRTKQTRLVDPQGDDFVDTTYDAMGRVSTVSNPHRSGNSSTDGISTTYYDALSRAVQVIDQDGSVIHTDYSQLPTVTVTDEAGKARKSQTDALGRLIRVWEDPSGLNYETDYQYDTLNNLLRVDQKGSAASDGTQWRTRLFTYDSFSRLLTAYNPESGTISYAYDADSNVFTKTAPAPNQTGTATVTTTYNYDALNRLTSKTYSDGVTLSANFAYDGAGWWGITQTNTVGRMQEAWLGQCCGAVIFGYDAVGRVVLDNQCLPDYCPSGGVPLNYTYDLLGDMTSYSNGVGVTLSQSFDTTGRVTQLTSSLSNAQHPATLATIDSSIGYYPSGELRKVTLANGITETAAYNNRLQPCRLNVNKMGGALASCGDAVIAGLGDFTYGYNAGTADNGNVVSFSSNGTQNFNRSYTYDSLNRLQAMSDPSNSCSGLSWTYDAWANRTDQTVTGGTCNAFHQAVNAQNWLSGAYQYDAAGNMTNDGSHSYTYDAENRLIQVDGGATAAYKYDALGRRIRKSSGGGWTNYVYAASGAVVTEYINGITNCAWPCWQASYLHMGGKLTAEYKDGTTYFFNSDHLGSTRFLTKPDQTLADSMDYLPYGEQIAGGTDTTHKFTGKERDAETGLDYFGARYYSNGMGRFITPDWAAKPVAIPYAVLGDPQSLNLYTYVRDTPTTGLDPTGHCDNRFCQAAKEQLQIQAGVVIGTAKFVGGAIPGVQAVQAMRSAIHTAKAGNAGMAAQAHATINAARTANAAAMGNEKAATQILTGVNNAWNNASMTDKASAMTQVTLTAMSIGAGAGISGPADPPQFVFRGGSASLDNLTPRPVFDASGLSTFDNLAAATPPGGKAQVIDTTKLTSLQAIPDPPPDGHVSITPGTAEGVADWAASRGTGVAHPYTQEVQNAIVDTVRRPKQ
jgi:RHS repeat-associated protein